MGVVWKSPIAGRVRVAARITHAHPDCGNGVAWWLEHRRGERASSSRKRPLTLGGEVKAADADVQSRKGRLDLLAVDAKNGDHSCDLTDIALTITEIAPPGRVWDLAGDVAGSVLAGNPHADGQGNKDTWSFVRGPSRTVNPNAGVIIPPASVLGRWRDAAADPARRPKRRVSPQRCRNCSREVGPPGEQNPDRLPLRQPVSWTAFSFKGWTSLASASREHALALRAEARAIRLAGKQQLYRLQTASLRRPTPLRRFGCPPRSFRGASLWSKDSWTALRAIVPSSFRC